MGGSNGLATIGASGSTGRDAGGSDGVRSCPLPRPAPDRGAKPGAGGIAHWHHELLRYVHRLTGDEELAEDLAQEAMLRYLRARKKQRIDNARAWLYRVTTNLVRDQARRRDMMQRRPVPAETDEPTRPDQEFERQEAVARVRAALERLSRRDREILVLRESGFLHREIAEIMNVQTRSVSVLAARALDRFRAAYLAETGR